MSKFYTGGCACGAVRYEARSEPVAQNHCQCRDCQRRSGTGHSSWLVFVGRADISLTGEPSNWSTNGDSGREKVHSFCPGCGSAVWLTFPDMPDLVAIPAASLDEPAHFTPGFVTYASAALAWDTLDPALKAFAKMPE